MATASPLKMKYSGGKAPQGVQSGAAPKIMKGARSAGAMYKPANGGSQSAGKKASDKSSGQSNPVKGSQSDRVRYTQAKQPAQYNNELRATKFVC